MFKARLYPAAVLAIVITAAQARALPRVAGDLSFRRKVIDKCDDAKSEISAYSREQQLESIGDLKLILKLDLTNFESLGGDMNVQIRIPAMNAPMEGVKSDEYWKTFNPDHENKAKLCALEILKSLSPHSIAALPEIIQMTQNHTLPHNLQSLVYSLIQRIVLDAANDQTFQVPDGIIERLIAALDTPSSYYAQNSLIELHKASLDKLLERMRDPDGKLRDQVAETLLRLDNQGTIIGGKLLGLIESPDDGLRKRAINMLSELEDFYPFSLPALIERLFDISPDIQANTLAALDRIFSYLKDVPRITLSDQALNMLFNKFLLSQGKDRQILARGLNKLMPLSQNYEKRILESFKGAEPELQADLISILQGSEKLSSKLKTLLFEALKERSSVVKIKALEVINHAKLNNKTSNAALLKLLDDANPEIKRQAESEIVKLDKQIASELLKFFKGKSAAEKPRLLRVMLKVAPKDKEVVALFETNLRKQRCENKAKLTLLAPQLTSKLRSQLVKDLTGCFLQPNFDYTLAGDALLSISPFEGAEKDLILKMANSEAISPKALVFVLLNADKLGIAKPDQARFVKRLLEIGDKTVKFRAVNYLNQLSSETITPLKEILLQELLNFFNSHSDDDLLANEALLTIYRLSPDAINAGEFFLKQIEGQKYQWAEKYIDKYPPDLALSVIEKALDDLSTPKKQIPISMAGKFGPQAAGLIGKIKSHLDSPDPNLGYHACVSLVKIAPDDVSAPICLERLLPKEVAKLLVHEDFQPQALPLFEKLKAASVSLIESRILDKLIQGAKSA